MLFQLYSEVILRELELLSGFNIGLQKLKKVRYKDENVSIVDKERKFTENPSEENRKIRRCYQLYEDNIWLSSKETVHDTNYKLGIRKSSKYKNLDIKEML